MRPAQGLFIQPFALTGLYCPNLVPLLLVGWQSPLCKLTIASEYFAGMKPLATFWATINSIFIRNKILLITPVVHILSHRRRFVLEQVETRVPTQKGSCRAWKRDYRPTLGSFCILFPTISIRYHGPTSLLQMVAPGDGTGVGRDYRTGVECSPYGMCSLFNRDPTPFWPPSIRYLLSYGRPRLHINSWLVGEKGKPIIICDADKAFYFVFPGTPIALTRVKRRLDPFLLTVIDSLSTYLWTCPPLLWRTSPSALRLHSVSELQRNSCKSFIFFWKEYILSIILQLLVR